jgi:hypothetical protein
MIYSEILELPMNIKGFTLLISILGMMLFSLNVIADDHLDQAIQRAEAAVRANDGKILVQYATDSKVHATDAKRDKTIDATHIEEGIKSLDDAMKEGKDGNTEAAKKATADAIKHFKQARK